MTVALLFPGQGSQHDGMLRWVDADPAAAPLLADLHGRVGADWRQRSAGDPSWLAANATAQRVVTALNLAAWRCAIDAGLAEAGAIVAAAGYSVGELAALCAAGVFDASAALALAQERAAAMDSSAAAGCPGGLLAASGRPLAEMAASGARFGLELAIRIGPDRCVLGGDDTALAPAADALAVSGARATRLPISVASHTSAMRAATATLAHAIRPLRWQPPRLPLPTNADGSVVRSVDAAKRCTAQQLSQTVQWQRCLQAVAERRPDCVLEVGPGVALSQQWLQAHPDIPARSIDEFGSAGSAVAWVQRMSTGG